ncbi:MAG: tRNA lysidine(34) synthetase TilS, partial [Tenericutes bacterium]|nr:tRNA lysidine(34) synthetase TilS [Mycoplasmatota bacterium]
MLKNINTNLVNDSDQLLLAISGGIDSMVLLHNMNELKSKMNIQIAVAYMDHQKRDNSNLDYELVMSTCKELNIDCFTEKLINNDKKNFHDYAHKERYNFFVRIAKKINANKIILAHNLNDNAETVLMRITRGSSFEGYRGILPVSKYSDVLIIRPLLDVSREEIVAYQQKYAITFNEDSSNSKNTYTRNRFRHNLLPLLEKENPKFLEKLKQFSDYQSMSYELIDNLSNTYLRKYLIEKDNEFHLSASSVI